MFNIPVLFLFLGNKEDMEKLEKVFLAGEYTPLCQREAEVLTKSPTVPESPVLSQSLLPPSTPQTHHPPKQGICTVHSVKN